jgi:hypothetical protein
MAEGRDAVLDALCERIAAAGGALVVPVRDLARDLGVPPQRLYYLIQAFEKSGALWTRSRGPRGLELHRGDGVASAAEPERRGGRSRFCPWCGHPAETGWKFCMACGKRLP